MVLRTPHGAGIRAPEHHSESTEAMLAHIPGLRVVIPSSPERAYGLLLAAIRDPDPVVFLEPTRLYRTAKGEVRDDGEALPLDRAFVLREGRDITLISWGAVVKETMAAADALSTEGIAAEVIDLATSSPMMKAPCSVRSRRPDVASSCTRRHAPADSEPRSQPLSPNVACPRCSRL
jgi:2-oxoisovalerate dehydrogenase E1 component beta subunit